MITFQVWGEEWKGTTCYMNEEDQKCLQNLVGNLERKIIFSVLKMEAAVSS